MPTSPFRRRWQRRLGRIEHDLRDLVRARYIFREVGSVVRANPHVQKPRLVHSWLSRNYGLAAASGIRRLTDKDQRSVSLLLVLEEIATNPSMVYPLGPALTRVDGFRIQSYHHQHFRNVAGPNAKHLPASEVRRDIRALKRVRDTVRRYVNKRVAHLDLKNRRVRIPTFREVHDAIDTLVQTFVKYRGLLTRRVGGNLEPTIQYNWKAVFREPWIPPKRSEFRGLSNYRMNPKGDPPSIE